MPGPGYRERDQDKYRGEGQDTERERWGLGQIEKVKSCCPWGRGVGKSPRQPRQYLGCFGRCWIYVLLSACHNVVKVKSIHDFCHLDGHGHPNVGSCQC